MWAHDRHQRILAMLDARGQVGAQNLADLLGVSRETIRRDLLDLDRAGRVRRVHGGAVLPEAAPEAREIEGPRGAGGAAGRRHVPALDGPPEGHPKGHAPRLPMAEDPDPHPVVELGADRVDRDGPSKEHRDHLGERGVEDPLEEREAGAAVVAEVVFGATTAAWLTAVAAASMVAVWVLVPLRTRAGGRAGDERRGEGRAHDG